MVAHSPDNPSVLKAQWPPLPWAMNFCPFGALPLKRALIERFSACEKICVDLCDLWACSPTCFFKRIERLGYSHRSHRFAQISPYGQCAFAESRVLNIQTPMVFLFCVDLRSVEKQITRQFLAPSAHSISHRSPRFAQISPFGQWGFAVSRVL